MSRLKRTNDAMNRRGRSLATEYDTALRASTKTGVRQKADLANRRIDDLPLPENDGVAPLTPANVRVEPLGRALRVSWNAPAEEEYVEFTRVRVTNTMSTGRVLVQEDSAGTSTTVVELPLEEHLVEVQHVDAFGMESPYSAWVSATPLRAVADEIDLARAQILGKLGWSNLEALTNAANLGNQVVTSRAMATQNFAALSAWIQAAAIENALIKDVKADKITTGQLKVEIDMTVGGKLTWDGGYLDDGGMTLGNLAKGASALPHTSPASWITSMDDGESPSPASGITAFRGTDNAANKRGLLIIAQGVNNSDRNGFLRLLATTGVANPQGALSTASIDLAAATSGGSVVSLGTDVKVARDIIIERNISAKGTLAIDGAATIGGKLSVERMSHRSFSGTVGANNSAVWNHGFGTANLVVHSYFLQQGTWRPVENNGSGLFVFIDASSVTIANNLSASRDIRIVAYQTEF